MKKNKFTLILVILFFFDGFFNVLQLIGDFVGTPLSVLSILGVLFSFFSLFYALIFSFIGSFQGVKWTSFVGGIQLFYLLSFFHKYLEASVISPYVGVEQLFFSSGNLFSNVEEGRLTLLFSMSIAPLIQMTLGIVALFKIKNLQTFKRNNTKNLLIGCSVCFGIILSSILGEVLGGGLLLGASVRGFAEVNREGVLMIEKKYQKNGRKLRLIPMVHVATKEFYQSITKNLDNKKTLFLLEGVQDKKNLLEGFSHSSTAKKLGLENQADHFDPEDFVDENTHAIVADVDSALLSKRTIEILKVVNKINQKFSMELYYQLMSLMGENGLSFLYEDIIKKRNQYLLQKLVEKEKEYEVLIVPWGGLHLPDIEKEILKLGYVPSGKIIKRMAFKFSDIGKD